MTLEQLSLDVGYAHDPGGKRRIPLPAGVLGYAVYGGEKSEYRYRADYSLDAAISRRPSRILSVILMNPSTAGERCFDPTLDLIWRNAIRLGYTAMTIGNTFAYRSTDQKGLLAVKDPIGPDNDTHLKQIMAEADSLVLAYGTPQSVKLRQRGDDVLSMAKAAGVRPFVFALSAGGRPRHPLYLPEPLHLTELT